MTDKQEEEYQKAKKRGELNVIMFPESTDEEFREGNRRVSFNAGWDACLRSRMDVSDTVSRKWLVEILNRYDFTAQNLDWKDDIDEVRSWVETLCYNIKRDVEVYGDIHPPESLTPVQPVDVKGVVEKIQRHYKAENEIVLEHDAKVLERILTESQGERVCGCKNREARFECAQCGQVCGDCGGRIQEEQT